MARRPIRPRPVEAAQLRASISRGPRDSDGRFYWRARLKGGDRDTVWTGWATRDEALAQLGRLEAQGLHLADDGAVAGCDRVLDLLDYYVPHVRDTARSPATFTATRNAGRHLSRVLGLVELGALSRQVLQRYRRARLDEDAASATVTLEEDVLGAAWSWGQQVGLVDRAQDLARLPRLAWEPRYSTRTPPDAELELVLDQLEGRRRLAVLLLWSTGARIGEIVGLAVEDIDIGRGEVVIRRGKTGGRRVPVAAARTLQAMAEAVEGRGAAEPLLELTVSQLRGTIYRAADRAGVARFRPHALRHLAVDTLLRAGVDPKTVASITGHSLQTMLRRYRHPTDEDRRVALARVQLGAEATQEAGTLLHGPWKGER